MSVEAKLMTADELLAMPDDGMKHELVRGELTMVPPPGIEHGDIAVELATHLNNYVKQHKLGKVYVETGYVLATDPDTVRGPDVSFVRAEHVIKSRKYYRIAPDLAVEVMSPDDRVSDVTTKVGEYLNAGTSVVIVIHPEKQVAWIYTQDDHRTLTIDDALTAPEILPGWSLPLRDLFA